MHESPVIWVDGERAGSLPLPDRGLEFGDGLFETILLHEGKPLYQELHLERLQCGLEILGFTPCMSDVLKYLRRTSEEICRLGWQWATLRLTVTRGSGARGYAPPDPSVARVVIAVHSIQHDCKVMPATATLGIASIRLAAQPVLAGIKHLNRLENVLAAQEARHHAKDEMLLLDHAEEVVSVTAGNVYIVRDNSIYTPPIKNTGVAGTRRRLIIQQWAADIGMPIVETPLTLSNVEAAQEVFYSNSLQTVRPVSAVGSATYSEHAVSSALFDTFKRALT